eukprot:7235518-Prymnesium_polylepis.2
MGSARSFTTASVRTRTSPVRVAQTGKTTETEGLPVGTYSHASSLGAGREAFPVQFGLLH